MQSTKRAKQTVQITKREKQSVRCPGSRRSFVDAVKISVLSNYAAWQGKSTLSNDLASYLELLKAQVIR